MYMLMVPQMVGVEQYDVYRQFGCLVLDSLVDSGYAGVVFRRVRLMAAFDPTLWSKYELMRFTYLSAVLPVILGNQTNVLLVGTRPTDVDLIPFDHVARLQFDEEGLRALSISVYGDQSMLLIDDKVVGRVVDDSVDVAYPLSSWDRLVDLLSRYYNGIRAVSSSISDGIVKGFLSSALSVVGLSGDLLVPEQREFLADPSAMLFSYDYLSAIRPQWHDAVVGILGQAPTISQAFKLPWYVVEPDKFDRICFRLNMDGQPAISMRGQSLVDLVVGRLSGLFTFGELLGTWIGAVLSQHSLVEQTSTALGGRTAVPAAYQFAPQTPVSTQGKSLYVVPEEYVWAYAACSGVIAMSEQAQQSFVTQGGVVVVPPTLGLVRHFAQVTDNYKRVEIAALIRRLHAYGGAVEDLISQLVVGIESVHTGEVSCEQSRDVLSLLPGLSYLSLFPRQDRYSAYLSLGVHPKLKDCISFYNDGKTQIKNTRVLEDLRMSAVRLSILSGQTADCSGIDDLPVGAGSFGLYRSGYCYLVLFKPRFHKALRVQLGMYPLLSDVLRVRPSMRIASALQVIRINFTYVDGRWVMHLSFSGIMSVATYLQLVGLKRRVRTSRCNRDLSVGADGCYPQRWFILAIISTTTSIVFVVLIVVWAIYKCRGQSRGGGGARYRPY